MLEQIKIGIALMGFLGMPNMAAAILIDFEAFADASNLHGINLGGVTITNPSGNVEVYDNRFGLAYHSPTNVIGSFNDLAQNVNPMVFTFDLAQPSVSLWAGDSGGPDSDSWTLNAYDAPVGGLLVDTANSGVFIGNPYFQLTVSAPLIWRVEATWNGPGCCGIGYDDLEFEVVPEPSTLGLFGLGLVALGVRRFRPARAE